MTIPEALEKYPIQLSAQLIRVWAQSEKGCPFCYIIRQKNGKTGRNTYFVNEQALKNFIEGKGVQQNGLFNN